MGLVYRKEQLIPDVPNSVAQLAPDRTSPGCMRQRRLLRLVHGEWIYSSV
jgi:hypothetical protein